MAQFDADETQPVPQFQHTEIREVESIVGQMILLPCTITNLGDRVVSTIISINGDETDFSIIR